MRTQSSMPKKPAVKSLDKLKPGDYIQLCYLDSPPVCGIVITEPMLGEDVCLVAMMDHLGRRLKPSIKEIDSVEQIAHHLPWNRGAGQGVSIDEFFELTY